MMLGEGWCPGVPFSSEDGTTTTYGQPLTTDAMFQAAVAHFDTALSLAETNARVLNGSKIGKGRALHEPRQVRRGGGGASAGIPTNFVLTTSHSSNSSSNGAWSASTSGASRYRLMTSEGKNGLPFLGQTRGAGRAHRLGGVDPRWIQQPVHGAAEPDEVRPVHRRRRSRRAPKHA